VSDNRDADIDIEPESFAAGANVRVPCVELRKADGAVLCNGRAIVTILDPVESVAVVDHARLDRCRGLNAVGWCWDNRGCLSRRRWSSWRPSRYAGANINTAPERLALVTDTSVPLLQVTQR
jgi:hypothetical protein